MPQVPARRHSLRVTIVLALAHALLLGLAFPPLDLWPLVFLVAAPLAWLAINAASTRSALLIVFAAQIPMWLWLNRWLIPVTAVGYPLLAIYISLFPVLFVWLIRRISHHPVLGAWPMTVVVPVVWVGVECLRGTVVLDGYPWFLVAHPVIAWPAASQSADLFGTYFVSVLVALVAGWLVDLARARAHGTWPAQRALLIGAGAAVAVVHAGNLAYGLWRLRQSDVIVPGPRILVIQTNLPQENKIGWPVEDQRRDVLHFIEQTIEAYQRAKAPIDLIVWPETMLPGVGLDPDTIEVLKSLDADESLYEWGERLVSLSRELNTPILVGSPAWVGPDWLEDDLGGHWTWAHEYNSAYLISGSPPFQRYDKVFLTPFGETMPYISQWPWLEAKLLALGATGMRFDLDASPTITRLELPRRDGGTPVTLATPICFEDTVARVCRRMVYSGTDKVAQALINLSNDGWFGSYDPGRELHVQTARWRCIENRVPMVRAANTGLSVSIDSRGIVVERVGEGRYGTGRREGSMEAELALDRRRTLYGRLGDVWAWACLALSGVLLGWTIVRRSS